MSMENRSQSNQIIGHLNLLSESLCHKHLHDYKRCFYNYKSTTDINLVYKKGKEMYLADALSRAYLPEIIYENFQRDIDSEKVIHLMSKHNYVNNEKTEQMRNEIASNSTTYLLLIQQLIQQINYYYLLFIKNPRNFHKLHTLSKGC